MYYLYDKSDCEQTLVDALNLLSSEYNLRERSSAQIEIEDISLKFVKANSLSVSIESTKSTIIEYNSLITALRGLSLAISGIETQNEICCFSELGVMIDLSRNAVHTMDYMEKTFRCLALLGYNQVWLYCEDTYILDKYPHFGFGRGGYSLEEIQQLDKYAFTLGVELIPCIQTLGHLEKFFRRSGATKMLDMTNVLMVGSDETYQLIEEMISFWRKACRTNQIHVGMDETHDLGRGNYLDKNGYEKPYDILNRHLKKVDEICSRYNFKTMMWSDMYFRGHSKTRDYYDLDANIAPETSSAISENTSLVYWDYYHLNRDFYDQMLAKHKGMNREVVMASAIWSIFRVVCDYQYTEERVLPCIESCRNNDIKRFVFTIWGDDGAYCDFDTMLSSFIPFSDYIYGNKIDNDKKFDKIAATIKCNKFSDMREIGKIHYNSPIKDNGTSSTSMFLWDDPLYAISYQFLQLDKDEYFEGMSDSIKHSLKFADRYPYFKSLAEFLLCKLELFKKLRVAYKKEDNATLKEIYEADIPELLIYLDSFKTNFRKMWLSQNRINGLETIQTRLGGQTERFRELSTAIAEYLQGDKHSLTLLDSSCIGESLPAKEDYAAIVAP